MAGWDLSLWQHPPTGRSPRRATSRSAQHHDKACSTMGLLQELDLEPGCVGLGVDSASLFLTHLAWFPGERVLGPRPRRPMAGRNHCDP